MLAKQSYISMTAFLLTLSLSAAASMPYDDQLDTKINHYLYDQPAGMCHSVPNTNGYERAICGLSATSGNKMARCIPSLGPPDPSVRGCAPFPQTPDQPNGDRLAQVQNLGSVLLNAGKQFHVDPRFILAISWAESNFGTNWRLCNPSYDAWNWGQCNNSYKSYDDYVNKVAEMVHNIVVQISKKNPNPSDWIPLIAPKYCPVGPNPKTDCSQSDQDQWIINVRTIYNELKGDVTDITFQPKCNVFSSGVDDTGKLLPYQSIDKHYSLVSGGTAYVIQDGIFPLDGNWLTEDTNPPPNAWLGPLPVNSQWIGPSPVGGVGPASAVFDYQTTFNVGDPSTFQLSGWWATDNEGQDILINGVSIKNGLGFGSVSPDPSFGFSPDTGFHRGTLFAVVGGFVAGKNTLDFIVHNDDGPTGVRVEFQGPNGFVTCQ